MAKTKDGFFSYITTNNTGDNTYILLAGGGHTPKAEDGKILSYSSTDGFIWKYDEDDDTWRSVKMIQDSTTYTLSTADTLTLQNGTGISLSYANGGTITINHSNSVTAITTAAFKKIKYDAQGHITGSTNVTKADITALGIPDSDTHYTTHLYIGDQDTNNNGTTHNGNTFIKLYDDTTLRNQYKIAGSGSIKVTSETNGDITIYGTDEYVQFVEASGGHNYPILFNIFEEVNTDWGYASFNHNVYINPALSKIHATRFEGNLIGNANTATYIAGGNPYQIVYQTAAGKTGFITAPTTNNYKLTYSTTSGFTWTADSNTDTKVSQVSCTTNQSYALLFKYNHGTATTTVTNTVNFNTGITVNPSTYEVALYTTATNKYPLFSVQNGNGAKTGLYAGSINTGIKHFSETGEKWLVAYNFTTGNTILECGNVGIGITNPSQKLHVNGNSHVEGTSYALSVGDNHTIVYPNAHYFRGPNSGSGAIAIKLPITGYKQATMLKFTVEIYNYVTSRSSTYHINGYVYTDGLWKNTSVYSLRDDLNDYGNLRVRFGHDSGGTRNIVWIGETNTAWSYVRVWLKDIHMGHGGDDYDKWNDGWEISLESTLSGTVEITKENPAVNYNAVNATNSTNATKLILYEGRSSTTDINKTTLGDGSIISFKVTSSTTSNKPLSDGHILHFNWDNNAGLDAQLFLPTSANASGRMMQIRGQSSGTWGVWKTVFDNYNSITPAINNTYNIGSSTLKWKNVYAYTGIFGGNATQWPIQITRAYNDGVNFKIGSAATSGNESLDMRISNNTSGGGNEVYIDLVNTGQGVSINPKLGVGIRVPAETLDVNGNSYIRGALYLDTQYHKTSYGIHFYNRAYNTWIEYMSYKANGPGGAAHPTGNIVTSWAMHNIIENAAGYGWIWESSANAAGSAISNMMELSSKTGNLWVKGSVTSSSFLGNATTATTTSYIAGGTPYQIVYQTAAGKTGFITAPTTNNYKLTYSTTSGFTWTADSNTDTKVNQYIRTGSTTYQLLFTYNPLSTDATSQYTGFSTTLYYNPNNNILSITGNSAKLLLGSPGANGIIGAPYSAQSIGPHNYIKFYGSQDSTYGGGLIYNAGLWTSNNIISHRFATTNNTYAFVIRNNGNIGIGISDPSVKFDVNGNTYIRESLSINNKLFIDANGCAQPYSTSTRTAGMYGYYNQYLLGHVWSMGTQYKISNVGKNPNNLYGMMYFNNNWSNNASYNISYETKNPLKVYASGHQIAFVANGTINASISMSDGSIWINKNGCIRWDENDRTDWNTFAPGLRVQSSIVANSGAPVRYASCLNVGSRYSFQIAAQGGDSYNFYIRNANNRYWNTLLHSTNTYVSSGEGTINNVKITKVSNTTNIAGGNKNDIPYQTAAATTSFISAPSGVTANSTYLLSYTNSGISWKNSNIIEETISITDEKVNTSNGVEYWAPVVIKRIHFSRRYPVFINIAGSSAGTMLQLSGSGYGGGALVRNNFIELFNCHPGVIKWGLPKGTGANDECSVDIKFNRFKSSSQSTRQYVISVISNANVYFTTESTDTFESGTTEELTGLKSTSLVFYGNTYNYAPYNNADTTPYQYSLLSSGMPKSGYHWLQTLYYANLTGNKFQLAGDYGNVTYTGLYIRHKYDGIWRPWNQVLTASSAYVNESGVGIINNVEITTATTATNIAGGETGQIPFQSTSNITKFGDLVFNDADDELYVGMYDGDTYIGTIYGDLRGNIYSESTKKWQLIYNNGSWYTEFLQPPLGVLGVSANSTSYLLTYTNSGIAWKNLNLSESWATYTYNDTVKANDPKMVLITIKSSGLWMLKFNLHLYNNYISRDISISGYRYLDSTRPWVNPRAEMYGTYNNPLDVTFGYITNHNGLRWIAFPCGNYQAVCISEYTSGLYDPKLSPKELFDIQLVSSSYINTAPMIVYTTITAKNYTDYATSATTSTNIAGGEKNDILYQSGTNNTAFISAPSGVTTTSTAYLLTYTNSGISWGDSSNIFNGNYIWTYNNVISNNTIYGNSPFIKVIANNTDACILDIAHGLNVNATGNKGGYRLKYIGSNVDPNNYLLLSSGRSNLTTYNVAYINNDGRIGLHMVPDNNSILSVNGNEKIKSGSLNIFPVGGNYNDGIRIHARSTGNTWSDIIFCGSDNTGDTGISAKSWFIGNNEGDFYINKNTSTGSNSCRLWGRSDGWTIGNTTASSYSLEIGGVTRINSGILWTNSIVSNSINRTDYLGDANHYWRGIYVHGGGEIHWNNLSTVTGTVGGNPGIPIVTTSTARGITRIHSNLSNNFNSPGNKLYGMSPEAITIEYTTNSGSTWTKQTAATSGLSEANFRIYKRRLTNGSWGNQGKLAHVGNVADTASGVECPIAVGMGMRITLDFQVENRVGYIDCLTIIYYTVKHKCQCIVERWNKNTDTWTTIDTLTINNTQQNRTIYPDVPFYMNGNSSTADAFRANKLRITMIVTALGTSNSVQNLAPRISGINGQGFGNVSITRNATYPHGRYSDNIIASTGYPFTISNRDSNIITAVGRWQFTGIGDWVAANVNNYADVYIGNSSDISTAGEHVEGRLFLYSKSQYYHLIGGASATAHRGHTLPDSNGWIVSGATTGVGSTTKPVYLKDDGTLQVITSFEGNSATATTANDIAGGSPNQILYQISGGNTGFITSPPTTTNVSSVLCASGTGSSVTFSWVNNADLVDTSLGVNSASANTNYYLCGLESTTNGSTNEIWKGNPYFKGNDVYSASDIKLKNNIKEISDVFVDNIFDSYSNIVKEFDWKSTNKHSTGFIAQELSYIIPEAVDYNKESYTYSVNYNHALSKLVGALLKKVKEQDNKISYLESLIYGRNK